MAHRLNLGHKVLLSSPLVFPLGLNWHRQAGSGTHATHGACSSCSKNCTWLQCLLQTIQYTHHTQYLQHNPSPAAEGTTCSADPGPQVHSSAREDNICCAAPTLATPGSTHVASAPARSLFRLLWDLCCTQCSLQSIQDGHHMQHRSWMTRAGFVSNGSNMGRRGARVHGPNLTHGPAPHHSSSLWSQMGLTSLS